MNRVRMNAGVKKVRVYREKEMGAREACNQRQENSAKGTSHPSCAMRGVHHGRKLTRSRWFIGLRDERVVVHSLVRGKLDRSQQQWLRLLWWASNGLQLHEDIWRVLLPAMGHGRSLARVGTVTSRKERSSSAGMEPLAGHQTLLRTIDV